MKINTFLSKNHTVNGPHVTLPGGESLKSTEEGYLPLSPLLLSNAKKVSIIPKLTSSLLILLGQLVNDGCTTVLDKHILTAIKTKNIVLRGILN